MASDGVRKGASEVPCGGAPTAGILIEKIVRFRVQVGVRLGFNQELVIDWGRPTQVLCRTREIKAFHFSNREMVERFEVQDPHWSGSDFSSTGSMLSVSQLTISSEISDAI